MTTDPNQPPSPENPEALAREQQRAEKAPEAPQPERPLNTVPEAENEDDLQSEIDQFDALIDMHLPDEKQPSARGEVIEVPVVEVREDYVLVDFGGKAEATVPLSEFLVVDGKPQVAVGDTIRVVQVGGGGGVPRLSHREARAREAEESIREAQENKQPVTGTVVETVKGGVIVDIGLRAFMPASQVDLFKIPDLTTMVGREIEAYVLEYDARRKRAVLSRRRLLFEQREAQRKEMLDQLSEGQEVTGTVKNALDFGVFLDLGVIDGFIPREEVSWDRGTHPKDIVKVGDEMHVRIIRIDQDSGKITLSRKRMTPDPWDTIEEKYPLQAKVTGKVIALQHYGAFVHLEEGVTAMIHAGDMSWAPGNKKPSEFVSIGDDVEALVLDVNKEQRRMSLGLKQVQMNPWQEAETKYPKGQRVKGTVTSMTSYGAFIRLDDYIEGMVHVSDMSWEKRINHPKEVLKAGEEVEAVVLKCDPQSQRISLGLKQLEDSPYDAFLKAHPVNSVVTGKVTRFAPFGAFVELAPNLEGLIHISQIDEKRVELPEKALKEGEEVTVKIIKADRRQQKISLSRKEAMRAAERQTVKEYMKKGADQHGGMTLGEALKQAQNKNED